MLNKGADRLSKLAHRYLLQLFMVALVVMALFYSCYDLVFEPYYPIADWLINYSQGFVRRGFIGEIILLAAHLMHVPPPWMVVVVQMAIYVAFLSGVYKLAAPLRRYALWYWIMFSPAALAFMILAPMNTVRKETLAAALLTATIFILKRRPSAVALSLIITAFFAAMVLSHDALFCCFPFFFAAVAVSTKDLKYAAKVMVLPFVLALLLMNLVRLHPGSEAIAAGVCRSVGGRWTGVDDTRDLCAGAIGHLGWTIAKTRHEEVRNLQYWPLYAVLAVLSLAPYVVALTTLYRRDGLRFEVKVIAWTTALCALASAPLFYLSIDWGRWIQMQVVCLLVLILFAAQRAKGFQPNTQIQPVGEGRWWRGPLLVGLFLYSTCWTLPVLGMQSVRFGYFDLPMYFHRQFKLVRQLHGYETIDRGW
jgi:hypothetical protein